ncbi:MAG: serine hydrolase, partial [Myxococcota bacterium]
MRNRRKTAFAFMALALAAALLASCSDTLNRIFKYGPSRVDNYKIFDGRVLKAAEKPHKFNDRTGENLVPAEIPVPGRKKPVVLESFIKGRDTAAFLIIRGNDLLYERYFNGYKRDSMVQIFSVSKSVTSMLVGEAIREGKLKGTDQSVTDLVPELRPYGFDAVKVGHLLQMTSGSDYCESDNPFGVHPAMYYGRDMTPYLFGLRLEDPPGRVYRYKSGDTELLGLMLSRALAPSSITGYAQKELWEPLGMEYDGFWATDRPDGLEKVYCC